MFEGLGNTVDDSGVLACHHACLGDVERRAKYASCEAGHGCAEDVEGHTVTEWRVLKKHLLVLVIGGDLGSVDHRISQDVGDDACPESGDASRSVDLAVAVDGA